MWQDLKSTVQTGLRELREAGDELSRQGRLRMDIFQTERRLSAAYGSLGEATHRILSDGNDVSLSNPRIDELMQRIGYYKAELERLRRELRSSTSSG